MTVKEFAERLNLKVMIEGEMDREITGCYIGDLLSWVMGRAPEDSAWLTVMGNINSIAVATLADVSCIVLVENAALDENAAQKADIHARRKRRAESGHPRRDDFTDARKQLSARGQAARAAGRIT